VLLLATGTTAWSYSFAPENLLTYDVTSAATDNAGNAQSTAGASTFSYNLSGPDSAVTTTGAFTGGTWPGAIAGTAATTGAATVTQVDVRVQRTSDGLFWDGLGWGAAAWNAATGTATFGP
jgi:hypothetical protein